MINIWRGKNGLTSRVAQQMYAVAIGFKFDLFTDDSGCIGSPINELSRRADLRDGSR